MLLPAPLGRPWASTQINEVKDVTALTFPEERQAAVWLAAECYTGEGEIVDGGSYFGGSALCLASGLARNNSLVEREKVGRIHAYDTFTWRQWIRKDHLPPGGVKFGTSFLNVFHDTIRKYEDSIVIHVGDIARSAWRNGPIELLFVDCAKSFGANAAIVEMFFPHLVPRLSIINQQDYAIASRLVWLHATMEYFADSFEELGSTQHGGTTLFRLTKRISLDDAQKCVKTLRTDSVRLAQIAAGKFPPDDRRRSAILASVKTYQSNPAPLS